MPAAGEGKTEEGATSDEALLRAAVKIRNLLDQKTGLEKRTLRKYLLVLERKVRSSGPRGGRGR